MNDIYLSIIVPVYNTEKYLNRCIDSIIQAIKLVKDKVEIIIINDGSKGNADEIIESYVKNFPDTIVYIKQENKGRGATRNVGISKARGKYISFIDSDDYIDKNMYLDMLSKLKSEDADIAICDFQNIIENSPENSGRIEAKNLNIEDNKFGCFDVLILPSCCNKIISKELFNNVKFPEHINYEDLAIIPSIVLEAKKIVYLPNMYYKYYQNTDSVMNKAYDIDRLNLIDALEISLDRIDNLNLSKEDKEKAEYMLCTRRFYEEFLEKIMFSSKKKELVKGFCDRIQNIEKRLINNKYFIKEISTQGVLKKIGNKLLHKAIRSKDYNKLNMYLKTKIYYRFFAIRYTNVI